MVSGGKLILVIVSSIHLCFACESPIENKDANRLLLSQVNPKIELHIHLEGTIRPAVAYELLKKRNMPIPGTGSLQSFLEVIQDLSGVDVLRTFILAIRGDLEAIERVAYELCQFQAEQGVIYTEVHYVPHLLLPESFHQQKQSTLINNQQQYPDQYSINVRDIVDAVNRGLDRGQRQFNVAVRSIISLVRTKPEWSSEVLDLAISFKDYGVVGIDMVGDVWGVSSLPNEGTVRNETLMFQEEHIKVFHAAARYGIKSTAHVGNTGPPHEVAAAIRLMKANRIAHGDRVIEDDKIFKEMIDLGVHFENCPSASTPPGDHNPVVRFARDGASFSVSSDAPTATKATITDVYNLIADWGLSIKQMQQTNIDAMENAFAEPQLKNDILNILLYSYYGGK